MCRMRGTYLEVGHISPNSFARLDVQKLVQNQIRFYGIQHYDPWILPNSIEFLMRRCGFVLEGPIRIFGIDVRRQPSRALAREIRLLLHANAERPVDLREDRGGLPRGAGLRRLTR